MSYDLSELGWDDTFASAYHRFDRSDATAGRVLRIERGICIVAAAAGITRAGLSGNILLTAAADPASLPCAGDWVVLRHWPDRRVTVECVLPRRTVLIPPAGAADSGGPALAANLDFVAIVAPIQPEPQAAQVARSLARETGAKPLLILTKSDTVKDPDAIVRRLAWRTGGVPVLAVSGRVGTGIEQLRAYACAGRTLVLVGRAGAGTSTLVNALTGTAGLAVRQLADGGRAGGAYRNLVLLPGGGGVLDVTRSSAMSVAL